MKIPFPAVTVHPPRGRHYDEWNLVQTLLNRLQFSCSLYKPKEGGHSCSALPLRKDFHHFIIGPDAPILNRLIYFTYGGKDSLIF